MIYISSKTYNKAAAKKEITKNTKEHIQVFASSANAMLPF
jgi:hypothetical protein